MRAKLMCATDLTARSDHAMTRTALLAREMNAQALFVHAVNDSQPGRVLRMKMNRAHARLMSQSERAMAHAPQDAEPLVRLGKPLSVITEVARESAPRLIVMAAARRRRLDAVLGTTAERVIRATQRPVLVVSGPARERYMRVVIATDLSERSAHAARTVAEMGVLGDAHAWVVHAFDPPRHGMTATDEQIEMLLAEHKRRWRTAVTEMLFRELGPIGVDFERVWVSAEPARPCDAIEGVIRRVRPDLLVLGVSRWLSLKRLLGGSVAHEMFRRIDCDVLAMCPPPARRNWLKAA